MGRKSTKSTSSTSNVTGLIRVVTYENARFHSLYQPICDKLNTEERYTANGTAQISVTTIATLLYDLQNFILLEFHI